MAPLIKVRRDYRQRKQPRYQELVSIVTVCGAALHLRASGGKVAPNLWESSI
jgi:hypothetical protein